MHKNTRPDTPRHRRGPILAIAAGAALVAAGTAALLVNIFQRKQ